jgi:Trk K+ transport system NAD-binding subunit
VAWVNGWWSSPAIPRPSSAPWRLPPGRQGLSGDYRSPAVLREAGVAEAGALVLAEDDDVGNLHAALVANELNAGLRLVVRIFNDVVAVEIDEEGRYVDAARRLGVPVIIGNATLPETLAAVRITEARCLVVATNDDEANLQMALNARAEHPAMRIVLRLFDPDLAVRIERAFGLRLSRSVSAVASGGTVAALEELIGGRVLLVERADASRWGPSPGEPVAAGLERLVDITARPG